MNKADFTKVDLGIKLSPELLAKVPPIPEGQEARFKLRTKGTNIPNSVSIPNISYVHDPKLGQVSIKYITGLRQDEEGNFVPVLGRIIFGQTGFITIPAGRRDLYGLYVYLYLASFNDANIGRDFHIPPPHRGYKFSFLKPAEDAGTTLGMRRRVRQAEEAIDKMGDELVKEIAGGFFPTLTIKHTDTEVLRLKLQDEVAKKNPESILNLEKDSLIKTMGFVKKAEEQGVIYADEGKYKWVFTENPAETICLLVRGENKYSSLAKFLLSSEGRGTNDMILELVNQSKAEYKASKAELVAEEIGQDETQQAGEEVMEYKEPPKKKAGRPKKTASA